MNPFQPPTDLESVHKESAQEPEQHHQPFRVTPSWGLLLLLAMGATMFAIDSLSMDVAFVALICWIGVIMFWPTW